MRKLTLIFLLLAGTAFGQEAEIPVIGNATGSIQPAGEIVYSATDFEAVKREAEMWKSALDLAMEIIHRDNEERRLLLLLAYDATVGNIQDRRNMLFAIAMAFRDNDEEKLKSIFRNLYIQEMLKR